MDEPVESPCIGVCTVGENSMCMGCFRTLDEIANWINFSRQAKLAVISQIPARVDKLFETTPAE